MASRPSSPMREFYADASLEEEPLLIDEPTNAPILSINAPIAIWAEKLKYILDRQARVEALKQVPPTPVSSKVLSDRFEIKVLTALQPLTIGDFNTLFTFIKEKLAVIIAVPPETLDAEKIESMQSTASSLHFLYLAMIRSIRASDKKIEGSFVGTTSFLRGKFRQLTARELLVR